jgi:hypothetical protein
MWSKYFHDTKVARKLTFMNESWLLVLIKLSLRASRVNSGFVVTVWILGPRVRTAVRYSSVHLGTVRTVSSPVVPFDAVPENGIDIDSASSRYDTVHDTFVRRAAYCTEYYPVYVSTGVQHCGLLCTLVRCRPGTVYVVSYRVWEVSRVPLCTPGGYRSIEDLHHASTMTYYVLPYELLV